MKGLIGQTVGSYRIIGQIGRGGMATVYKAYQPSMERYVALKILPDHYAHDPNFVQRFVREARTIAKLEHKNILPVYDFGEDGGVTYLAMRYLESGTLKDVQGMGRLTLADAANIMRQMCSALDYAHRQGVVHRDVKPSNIMVDDEGEAYLTDFGIAKVLEGTEQLTASGGFLGTPAYMAPEQVMAQPVDSRADIYALGIMLYETIVGRVPYDADTPMAVALAHVREPLPLPRELNAGVPEPLEAVILKALAKKPADRYQTAGQLAAALDEALAEAKIDVSQTRLQSLATAARLSRSEQTTAYDEARDPLTTTPRPTAFAQRRVWPQLAVALLLFIAIGASLLLVSDGLRPGAAPDDLEGSAQVADVASTVEQPPLQVSKEQTAKPPIRATQTAVAMLALTPLSTPTQTSTPPPTPVPRPTDPPLLANGCESSLCIFNYLTGELISEVSLTQFEPDFSASWSPDGRFIVLAACDPIEAHDVVEGCGNLFRLDPESGAVAPILLEVPGVSLWASLSPDGELIAFHHGGELAVIGLDSLEFRTLVPGGRPDDEYCPEGVAWSPDSQRLAWLGIIGCGGGSFPTGVYVIHRDGTGLGKIYDGTVSTPPVNLRIAWSPDDDSVAVSLIDGTHLLIDADCHLPPNSCDESSRQQIAEIPRHWFDDIYPRWYGEELLTEH